LACGAVEQDLTWAGGAWYTLGWWFAVNLRKLVGFLVVIFVLFWIISKPGNASGSVNDVLANLRSAGDSIATFMTNIF
jgi:hypothetical protein